MNFALEGKVAIVTGASSGLGWAITEAFVAEGASVVAVARSTSKLQELAAKFPDKVHARTGDLRIESEVQELPNAALAAFGRLDIIVNNAGIAPAGPFASQGIDVWREVLAVNVLAPAILCRAAAPILHEQRAGKVINVASTAGVSGKPLLVAYSSSKGAVLQFTKALAAEWAKANVQVNAIAPGAFASPAQSAVLNDPTTLVRRLRKIPAGRMGQPWEIGPLACLLASSGSDFITGSVFVIDGGEVAKL